MQWRKVLECCGSREGKSIAAISPAEKGLQSINRARAKVRSRLRPGGVQADNAEDETARWLKHAWVETMQRKDRAVVTCCSDGPLFSCHLPGVWGLVGRVDQGRA